MHFFAQIKPKSHIHVMWTSHLRKSAMLNNVLFTADADGVYSSGELTDEQIGWFRTRDNIVKLIVTGVVPFDSNFEKTEDVKKLDELLEKPRRRPQLK